MDHYIDIRLLPDPEFPAPLLMNALFGKLHRGLAEAANGKVGISFPEHDDEIPKLGTCLRLHGDQEHLLTLMAVGWLTGMRDHTHVSEIYPIPTPEGHIRVRRVQAKSSPERLRRRYMRRHHVDAKTAQEAIPNSTVEYVRLPYVTLNSQSTGQRFRLFIAHDHVMQGAAPGLFSDYGLSATATVPWF